MKTNYKLLPLLMIALFFITSCSIEKRIYRPGFSLEWNASGKSKIISSNEQKNVAIAPSRAFMLPEKKTEFQLRNTMLTLEKNATVYPSKSKSELKDTKKLSKEDKSKVNDSKLIVFQSIPKNASVVKNTTASNGKDRNKKDIGLQYRLLALAIAGFGIQKVATAIQQNEKGDGTGKKKTPVWLWILLIVVLIVAAGSLAMTLAAV